MERHEEHEEANECKRAKYSDQVTECKHNCWRACCNPADVGWSGIAGHSLERTHTKKDCSVGRPPPTSCRLLERPQTSCGSRREICGAARTTTWTQVEECSALAGSPGRQCAMIKNPKCQRVSSFMCPSSTNCIPELFVLLNFWEMENYALWL